MPWFVLYTKPRNEKLVAEKLRLLGIEVYCPLIIRKKRWSDRIKKVEEPLFRSYCFVQLEEKDRAKVFAVPQVVRYLFWLQKPAIVRDEEIDAIRLMLNEFDHNLIHVEQFTPSARVKIGSGSFTDVTGVVEWQQGTMVSIRLDSLQIILRVDISKTIVAQEKG